MEKLRSVNEVINTYNEEGPSSTAIYLRVTTIFVPYHLRRIRASTEKGKKGNTSSASSWEVIGHDRVPTQPMVGLDNWANQVPTQPMVGLDNWARPSTKRTCGWTGQLDKTEYPHNLWLGWKIG